MRINHVKISSILGIDELEFDAGKFNEISGSNGQGKTSVLEAIKAAMQGGHDASLLRKGADKGEIVLVLDDGTEISKRITERASPITVTQGGEKAKRPTDVLKTIADMLSVNPVDFLRAPKKDRVKVLLETMPLEADTAKLAAISGVPVSAQPGVHALAVIEAVRKQVYDDRTGTNRAVKEKDATINQLRLAMPEAPDGVEGSEDDLDANLQTATGERDALLGRIQAKLDGLKADAQSKIDAIRAKAQADIDAVNAELADQSSRAAAARDKAHAAHASATEPIKLALAAIRANRSAAAKREQTQQTVATLEAELEDLMADADAQTKAIEQIDAYKVELLASLPIPGLEVVDGELFREGVPFDRLNTAQQVEIAVEIAKLRAGDLKVCCVDGLELLSTDTFDAFRKGAMDSGLQLFVTRVKDGDFQVKTDTE